LLPTRDRQNLKCVPFWSIFYFVHKFAGSNFRSSCWMHLENQNCVCLWCQSLKQIFLLQDCSCLQSKWLSNIHTTHNSLDLICVQIQWQLLNFFNLRLFSYSIFNIRSCSIVRCVKAKYFCSQYVHMKKCYINTASCL
jgi:hypothetical protein